MSMQEYGFSPGENSNRMLTVTPFNGNLKVHVRQFHVNENGKRKLVGLELLHLLKNLTNW